MTFFLAKTPVAEPGQGAKPTIKNDVLASRDQRSLSHSLNFSASLSSI